jgi:N-acetylmuramoyl-L-alanine amidase
MTQKQRPRATSTSRGSLFFGAIGGFLSVLLLIALPARGDDDAAERRTEAHAQFDKAEAMRAQLEAKAERERSIKDYQQLVNAYRRVYLITPHAVEVPGALREVGDLYRTMGQQFEPKYFDSAVEAYEFLLHEYPMTNYREDAQLAIAAIQRNNLAQTNLAQRSYQDFLSEHPHSPHADEARHALTEIQTSDKADAVRALPPPPASAPPAAPNNKSSEDSETGQVRVWNADTYTRIIIPLSGQAKYQAARISDPDRIYFDIEGAKLGAKLSAPVDVPSGGYLKAVRMAQNNLDVVRVVLEVTKVKDYSVFELANPDRLVVDVYGPGADMAPGAKRSDGTLQTVSSKSPASEPALDAPDAPPAASRKTGKNAGAVANAHADAPNLSASGGAPGPVPGSSASALAAIPAPRDAKASNTSASKTRASLAATASDGNSAVSLKKAVDAIGPAPVPEPTHIGEHSLTRALGLKIGRIVIDAGHGGHDTGTIGPSGLMEKDLCLDLALRLGKLIEARLPGADVVYTRSDDAYVSLEQRTAVANNSKADLFLSIHANSSDDPKVTGIETYYLNFNASPGAMDVAARENALAQSGVHDLEDLVQKIARNEKIEESRDFATDIQDSLAKQAGNTEHSRGVRRAPFVVLIGADMPSVLAEVSFLSNPADEQSLKKPEARQRIAEGLYHGIETYLHSTNSLTSTAAAPAATAAQPISVARSDDR